MLGVGGWRGDKQEREWPSLVDCFWLYLIVFVCLFWFGFSGDFESNAWAVGRPAETVQAFSVGEDRARL